MATSLTPLAGAILGLINEEPRSGYDLRRVFALTPMGHFSDSPGAIYPALRRLRDAGLVESSVDTRTSLRPREIFRLTASGYEALEAWATAAPSRDEIIGGVERVTLRFVLAYSSAGPAAARRVAEQLEQELVAYAREPRHYYKTHAPSMHAAARLGMEAGIAVFDTHIAWCGRAMRVLSKETRKTTATRKAAR